MTAIVSLLFLVACLSLFPNGFNALPPDKLDLTSTPGYSGITLDPSVCDDHAKSAFRCNPNLCIQLIFRCDGIPQCPNGEDEMDCTDDSSEGQENHATQSPNEKILDPSICNSNQKAGFRCSPEECINLHLRCDGEPNCSSGADEEDCDEMTTLNNSETTNLKEVNKAEECITRLEVFILCVLSFIVGVFVPCSSIFPFFHSIHEIFNNCYLFKKSEVTPVLDTGETRDMLIQPNKNMKEVEPKKKIIKPKF